MRQRVTAEQAEIVRKMLAAGFTHRAIAKRLNMSPVTVWKIAHGHWRPESISDDPFWELRQKAKRCPGCGGLVYQWPCALCAHREREERRQRLRRISA